MISKIAAVLASHRPAILMFCWMQALLMPAFLLPAFLLPAFLMPALLMPASAALAGCVDDDDPHALQDATVIQTLLRLPGYDYQANPKAKAAVERELQRRAGTPGLLELVEQLEIRTACDQLVDLALKHPSETMGVNAAVLLGEFDARQQLDAVLQGDDVERQTAAATVLGMVGDVSAVSLLKALVADEACPPAARNAAARGLGKSQRGQRALMTWAEQTEIPPFLKLAVADSLHSSRNPQIRARAQQLLPLPAGANSEPLPPISELTKRRGQATAGKVLFDGVGTCHKCHVVRGQGKAVGPELSEIGGKLSQEAIFVSILDPSAGVSHNYETYSLITLDGDIESGLLVSETADEIHLKNAEGIERVYQREDIDEFKKQAISLMPADLQKNMTAKQLVDLVAYLMTLKKATP